MPIYTLKINAGTPATLASLGLGSPVINRRSLDVSELRLTVMPAAVSTAAAMAYGDHVALLRDGVAIFRGTVTALPVGGNAAELRRTYTISDAWWQLARIIYMQPAALRTEDFAGMTATMTTRITLGQDAWGRKWSVDKQIQQIAAYGLRHASGAYALASLSSKPVPPLSEARDITCAEAIRRCVAIVPNSVAWFDYEPEIPVLHLEGRGDLPAVDVDVSDKIVRSIAVQERPDLQPAGVRFTFLTTEEDDADGRSYTRETVQSAGSASGPGIIAATIQLVAGEEVPTGLASAYFAALNYTPWSGAVVLKEADCSRKVQLGERLNLIGFGDAAWETMGAVVQATTEQLDTGETTLELGLPEHLAPQDFVTFMSFWRNRPPPSDWPNKQSNGTEGVDDGATDPGVDGFGGGASDTDPEERTGNPDAGRPSGGPGSGGGGAIGGSTATIPKCIDGIEQDITVLRAP